MTGIEHTGKNNLPEHWLGAGFLAAVGLVYLVPTLFPSATGSAYIGVHALLTIIMLFVWQRNCLSFSTLLLIGIFARLLITGVPVFTTHDVERYLWDGAVVLSGQDPYVTSANASVVSDLREYWPTPEENAKYSTIYPPGALILYAISALFGPTIGIFVWKLMVAVAGSLGLFVAAQLFGKLGLEKHFPLIALSPLLILEGGVGGHIDAITTSLIIASVYFFIDKRFYFAGTLIGLATSMKLFPIIFLAPMLGYLGLFKPDRRHVSLIVGAVATLALIYGAAILAGYEAIGVLTTFFEKWRFGSPIYLLIETYFTSDMQLVVSLTLAVMLTLLAAGVARKDLMYGLLIMAAAPFFISPVVYPWYLMVLVPFVAMRPSALIILWISIAPVSYEVIDRYNDVGIWAPATWPIYAIVCAWLIGGLIDVSRFFPYSLLPKVIKTT